jgi:hypothetical protein
MKFTIMRETAMPIIGAASASSAEVAATAPAGRRAEVNAAEDTRHLGLLDYRIGQRETASYGNKKPRTPRRAGVCVVSRVRFG